MSVFKRGGVYWYEFEFIGPAHTRNNERARSIERARRKAMEESAGGVKRPKPRLFRKAAKTWLAGNAHWSESYREINTLKLSHLMPVFGRMLLTDIDNDAISRFQRKRQRRGSPKLATLLFSMVGEARFELATPGLEGRCSIQLSYSPR